MSNLVLNFKNKNIVIEDSNKYCCKEGVLINFKLENGALGQLYNCTITNIGSGSVLLKPSSFSFNFNKRVEEFAVFAELSKSRVNLIKVNITNSSNSADSVEDIVYIECGSLQKLDLSIPQEQLNIECGSTATNSIIPIMKNLTIGEKYSYSFQEYSSDQYENLSNQSTVNILSSSGNKYILNNANRYDENLKYIAGNGTYILKGIPEAHPIAILNSGIAEITYTGDEDKRIGEKEVDGAVYDFYYGDVTITVTGDYGVVSVYCIYHGYMGGEGLFLYQKPVSDLVFSPSSGVITANRTEQNINSVLTYTGDKQFFIMNVSITDPYNDFIYSENFTMKCS